VSAYDGDPRVKRHPDGSWMVFSSDYRTEWFVVGPVGGKFHAFDANGFEVSGAGGKPSLDDAIAALIGEPKPTGGKRSE
jgi:hypothetical protein